jgi:hypothetical protein
MNPKRIEYKEAICTTTSLNFWSILGPSQKERGGGGWYWTLFIAAILLPGILTIFSQLTTTLSILKEINKTKYKDFNLTRWTRKLATCHRYQLSDECIFTMFFKSKYAKLQLLWRLNCLHWWLALPPLPSRQGNTQYSFWSQIHEHTTLLWFLGIILRVLRLEVSL